MSYQETGLPPTGFAEKYKLGKITGTDELDPHSPWYIPEASEPGQIAIGWHVYDGDVGVAFQLSAVTARTEPIDDRTRKVIGDAGPYLPPHRREFSKARRGYIDKVTDHLIRDVMELTGRVEGVDQPVKFVLYSGQVQEVGGALVRRLSRIQIADASGKRSTAPIWLSRLLVTTALETGDNDSEWRRFNFEIAAKPGEPGAPSGEEIKLGAELAQSVFADAKAKGWIVDEPPTPTSSRASRPTPTSAPTSSRPASLMTVHSGKVWDEPPQRADQPPPPTSEADYDTDVGDAYGPDAHGPDADARDGWPQ